jgi:hypothetical protein
VTKCISCFFRISRHNDYESYIDLYAFGPIRILPIRRHLRRGFRCGRKVAGGFGKRDGLHRRRNRRSSTNIRVGKKIHRRRDWENPIVVRSVYSLAIRRGGELPQGRVRQLLPLDKCRRSDPPIPRPQRPAEWSSW